MSRHTEAVAAFHEAVANAQIHPAVADVVTHLAVYTADLAAQVDRLEKRVEELGEAQHTHPDADPEPGGDQNAAPEAPRKATPASVARKPR